jgi:hypothetical protein
MAASGPSATIVSVPCRSFSGEDVVVEPDRIESFLVTVETAITPLGLTFDYAPDLEQLQHRVRVSRELGSRHVTYLFSALNITAADAQELIAAITQDFPPIAYEI